MGKRGFFFPPPRPEGAPVLWWKRKSQHFTALGFVRAGKRPPFSSKGYTQKGGGPPKRLVFFGFRTFCPARRLGKWGTFPDFRSPRGTVHVKCTMIFGRARKSGYDFSPAPDSCLCQGDAARHI